MPKSLDWVGVEVAIILICLSLVGAGWILAAGSSGGASPASGASASSADSIKRDAFRLASHSRDVVVVVAAARGGPVKITAIGSDSAKLRRDAVSATANAQAIALASGCGWNCFRGEYAVLDGAPVTLGVVVRRRGRPPAQVALRLPAELPPRGDRLLRAMRREMAEIRTLRVAETLSNGEKTLRTQYLWEAPNRMSYRMAHGPKAVVIGSRRWDWLSGRWQASTTDPIPAPAYMWAGARRPWLLGTAVLRGRRVRILSLFRDEPRFPAWFRLFVDTDNRVRQAEMLSVGHFMVERFSAFDEPVVIEPPT